MSEMTLTPEAIQAMLDGEAKFVASYKQRMFSNKFDVQIEYDSITVDTDKGKIQLWYKKIPVMSLTINNYSPGNSITILGVSGTHGAVFS